MEKKKIKSYTSIWRVDRIIYALSDLPLPIPMTSSQITWFVGSFMVVLMFGKVFPLSLIDNMLMKNIILPIFITWFMSAKSFDGKRPYSYVRSMFGYCIRPKEKFCGKRIKYRKVKHNDAFTAVRSDKIYVSD